MILGYKGRDQVITSSMLEGWKERLDIEIGNKKEGRDIRNRIDVSDMEGESKGFRKRRIRFQGKETNSGTDRLSLRCTQDI